MSSENIRAQGALLGQCIGDTLGGQVEFMDAAKIKRLHPKGVRDIVGGGPHRLKPGQITDDSELALTLARSIVKHNGYDKEAVARAYVDWYKSGPFDIGSTTINAFSCIDTEKSVADQCVANAKRKDTPSNGSLMRVSPLGICGAIGAARFDSSLSHSNPLCVEACSVFVASIATAIGHGLSRQEVFNFATETARGELSRFLSAAEIEPPREADGWKQGWVAIAFQNAFHQLLYAKSFEEGIVNTISLGGDTDTNAAIAGALLGAVFGKDEIPNRWRKAVLQCETDRGATYQTNDLEELALKLLWVGEDLS